MNLKQLSLFSIGLLFSSIIYGQIDFQEHEISSSITSVLEPQSVVTADIDGDGDKDIISASQGDDKIAWFENINGAGNFGQLKVISSDVPGAIMVKVADMDGDGDNDVLSIAYEENYFAWHENQDGLGTFGPPQIIESDIFQPRAIFAMDMDSDQDMDIITASTSGLHWFENKDGLGDFDSQIKISTSDDILTDAYPADLDGDGDIDIVGASGINSDIFWYENTDGLANFSLSQQISAQGSGFYSLFTSDLDNDGDMDIIAGFPNTEQMTWYENTDGEGAFGAQQIIGSGLGYIRDIFSEDVDGDNDMDIIIASANMTGSLNWIENIDGQGDFGPKQIISYAQIQLRSLFVDDLDEDGKLDLVTASETDHKVAWYRNIGFGNFGSIRLVSNNLTAEPRIVRSEDLDGDGDKDVVFSASEPQKVGWYENIDGQGTFGPQQVIATATNLNGYIHISIGDVDGDGDLDIVTANSDFDEVAWYENEDGLATFGPKNVISAGAFSFETIVTADIDGDGDLDAISSTRSEHTIAWFENMDGLGDFGLPQLLSTNLYLPHQPIPADVDGDGDLDILNCATNDDLIVWYENTDGEGAFGSEIYLASEPTEFGSVYPVDLDDDGDLDVFAKSFLDGELAWYENDGEGNFEPVQNIDSELDFPGSLHFTDIDGDGDLDFLLAITGENSIVCYENTDGQGTFGSTWMITDQLNGPRSIDSDDIDGDGIMDFLAISYNDNRILWFENSLTEVGIDETVTDSNQLLVFPNPASNIVEIEFIGEDITIVELFSLDGKKITASLTPILDVSKLKAGIYIVKATTRSGKTAFKKLCKNGQ